MLNGRRDGATADVIAVEQVDELGFRIEFGITGGTIRLQEVRLRARCGETVHGPMLHGFRDRLVHHPVQA